jgi:hypothetical protein
VAAVVSTEAATTADGSSGLAVGAARCPQLPLPKQLPAYTSVNGYLTYLVPLLAGSEERLPLPFRLIEVLEGLTHTIMEERSSGQPSYDVELFYDGEGKCYFCGGWPKFFEDYGLRVGWSLILTRHSGSCSFGARVVDDSSCARAFIAWV